MQLKTGLILVLTSLILTGLTSCLGDNDEYIDSTVSTDAQLVAFGISSDSLKTLASVVFSIDQVNGEIYNHDSLPYLTNLDTLVKVKLSFTTGLGYASSVSVEYNELDNDTVWVASGDSIKIDTASLPLKLQSYAQDGTSKTYTLRINVHQIDPDSVQYHPINVAEVPVSTDIDYSTSVVPFTDYPVVAVLGLLHPNADSDRQKGLVWIVDVDGEKRFATYSKDLEHDTIGAVIPKDFPLTGFSRLNSTTFGRPPLTLIENLQSVWATENGLYWTNLSDVSNKNLPKIEGGSAFFYNNEIWFILGQEKIKDDENYIDGEYSDKVYYSQDGGIVWKTKPAKTQVPTNALRKEATIRVDDEGKYFYILWGNKDGGLLATAWKASLNSRLFKED